MRIPEMAKKPVIVWFRNDLRLEDNPALHAASESGAPIIALYIFDDSLPHAPGAASRWWLHHSLMALGAALEEAGLLLILRRGESRKALMSLVEETGAGGVVWNRRYHGGDIDIDKRLKRELEEAGLSVQTFNASLLREPWEATTKSGGPYRVFTPFWKWIRQNGPARRAVLRHPSKYVHLENTPASDALGDWRLLPTTPDWAGEFSKTWSPGEAGAHRLLVQFLDRKVARYETGRDRPDRDSTSRLSPHLAFGEIGPLQIWIAVKSRIEAGILDSGQGEKFLSEIAWREFSYNLLFHHEKMPEQPLRAEFENYPWREDKSSFDAWAKGLTGYPIVDAGMRQLRRTGWMHNRVRMITASFLVKDLLIPWQDGEAWFRDMLVDADLANNAAGWQWVAGCGADAAPYFRIFNPVSQGEKFDPEGDYVRKFVPELASMPAKHIHAPWRAPQCILQEAGVSLGISYPKPIIDHAHARRRALAGYDIIRRNGCAFPVR